MPSQLSAKDKRDTQGGGGNSSLLGG